MGLFHILIHIFFKFSITKLHLLSKKFI